MQRFLGIALILFCAIGDLTAEPVQDEQKTVSPEQVTSQCSVERNDPRADLAKMQTLLGQMQRNVAFVSPGDTPLKHQFQLEIEMWQLLLRDIETKLNAQQATPAK